MDPRKLVVLCAAVLCMAATLTAALTAAGTAVGAASEGEPDWIALGAERLPLLSPCEHWPHRKSDHYLGVPRPRPLPIPTVMISGRWDPVTPPAYGEDASASPPLTSTRSLSVAPLLRLSE